MNRLSDAPVRAERGRVAYLDMLRIAATVAVVMIHVAVRDGAAWTCTPRNGTR